MCHRRLFSVPSISPCVRNYPRFRSQGNHKQCWKGCGHAMGLRVVCSAVNLVNLMLALSDRKNLHKIQRRVPHF